MNKQMPPLAVEPLEREWGVGVSGLTKEPSPFPRINRMLDWVNNTDSTADDQRAKIVTECYDKYAAYTPALRWALTLRELYERVEIHWCIFSLFLHPPSYIYIYITRHRFLC